MGYDEGLAQRVRTALRQVPSVAEQKMFGGLAFMVRGHMTVGVDQASLMVRVDRADYEDLLAAPHAREMRFTGRALRGFLFVDPPGLTGRGLGVWVRRALSYTMTLPPKQKAGRPRRSAKATRPSARPRKRTRADR